MKQQNYLIICLIGTALFSYAQATFFNGPNCDGFLLPNYFENLAKQEEKRNKDNNKKRIIVLLQARHPRLGENSPARYIDGYLFQKISNHLNS